MRRNWMVIAGILLGIGSGLLRAQDTAWSKLEASGFASKGNKVFVVAESAPNLREACRIRSVEADRIVCAEHFGRNRKEFRTEDVRAVIAPAYHEHLLRYWLTGAVPGTALIVAGAILSGPWAIAAIVIGSVVDYCATFAVAFGTGDYPETVLYLKPGTALP